jgi:hypothetical protein
LPTEARGEGGMAMMLGFVPRATSGKRVGRSLKPTRTAQRPSASEGVGGEGGIRTHVPLTGQDAFEAPPLRPLRYLSGSEIRRDADLLL